jgi:hypothetical protein
MTTSPGSSGNYQDLQWLGRHTDGQVDYAQHAYGPFEGHKDNLYLVRRAGSKVEAEVSRHGLFVKDDAKSFDLPSNPSDTDVLGVVQEACKYLEGVNRRYWQNDK